MQQNHMNEELEQASVLYQEFLEMNVNDPDVWDTFGMIFLKHCHFELALELSNKTILLRSHNAYAYYHRANILQELQRYDEALEDYTHAIILNQHFPEAYFNRALIYKTLRQYEASLQDYDQAIKLNPSFAVAHSNRGNLFKLLECYEEALENYNKAIALDPEFTDAYSNRGLTLHELKRYHEALESYNKAIALNPEHTNAYCNKADTLKVLNRCEEALENYNRAIALNPSFVEAYCNRGNALKALRRYDEALASYNKAIELNASYPNAYRNKAILLMLLGDLKQGLELYEWRWLRNNLTSFAPIFPKPLWLGEEDLTHKTILIHSEQGFGDVIHFCRYIELVSHHAEKVIFTVEPSLYPLLKAIKGVSCCILKSDPLPFFDYHCPLLSVPFALKSTLETIPNTTPYIQADEKKVDDWKRTLKNIYPRIGIVWSGNYLHNNDHNRSLTLETLVPYLPDGFDYICLQKELREVDRTTLENHPHIHFFGNELSDFSDTAALCECMDFIISVDTSVAHLAGAMHKKTLILLPYAPDWRWFDEREDSPWYPSVRLLRQKNINDWQSCLIHLAPLIQDMVDQLSLKNS